MPAGAIAKPGLRFAAVAVVLALLCVPVAGASRPAGDADPAAVLEALAALSPAQRAPLAAYLVEAAVANGLDPAAWPADAPALSQLPDLRNVTVPSLLRPLHALAHAGRPDAEASHRVLQTYDGNQFGEAVLHNDDAWSILALRAAGVEDPRIAAAARTLLASQDPGGGWSWQAGSEPDVDTTGMVLEALRAAGTLDASSPGGALARTWLLARADPAGGFPSDDGADAQPNCDSTVWAIRGLWALGDEAPESAWRFLAGLQQADGGLSFMPRGTSNAMCTAEAATLLGLAQAGGHATPGWTVGGGPKPDGPRAAPALPLAPLLGAVATAAAVTRHTLKGPSARRP